MSLHNIFWGSLSLDGGSLKIGIPQVAVGFSNVSVLKCSSMTWMVEVKNLNILSATEEWIDITPEI